MNKTNASLFTILYISQNNSSITVTWNCKCECIDNATKEIKKPLAGWSKYYRSLPCRVSGLQALAIDMFLFSALCQAIQIEQDLPDQVIEQLWAKKSTIECLWASKLNNLP